jgi:hypothetical protein
MKLGCQNYDIIMSTDSCFKFNNNKLNSLKHMTLNKITKFYTIVPT